MKNKIMKKGFIQIPLLVGIIIAFVVVSGTGAGYVLYEQKKLDSLTASVSQIPTEQKENNTELEEIETEELEIEESQEETNLELEALKLETEKNRIENERLKKQLEEQKKQEDLLKQQQEAERLRQEAEKLAQKIEEEQKREEEVESLSNQSDIESDINITSQLGHKIYFLEAYGEDFTIEEMIIQTERNINDFWIYYNLNNEPSEKLSYFSECVREIPSCYYLCGDNLKICRYLNIPKLSDKRTILQGVKFVLSAKPEFNIKKIDFKGVETGKIITRSSINIR